MAKNFDIVMFASSYPSSKARHLRINVDCDCSDGKVLGNLVHMNATLNKS
jgi:hypothetical protein